MAANELGTRVVAWQQIEFTHARNRPHAERPPLPLVGQQVRYRRHDWDHNSATSEVEAPELVTVVRVQPLDDRTDVHWVSDVGACRDPNLWHLIRDRDGQPLRDGFGQLRYAPVADPWPTLWLRRPNGIIAETRESRLRGSAGWLPLDYRSRRGRWRLPAATALVTRPPLPLLLPGVG